MMVNLKPVYDAAVAADAKVNEIMAEMAAAFAEGTDEGKQKALDLRAALNTAQDEARQANELYVQMRDAQANADEHAKNFVPVPGTTIESTEGGKPSAIKREAYDGMSPVDRATFIRSGGTIED